MVTHRNILLGSICGWLLASAGHAEGWDPFPVDPLVNDFGGVGLLQTPTARFGPDGQIFFGGSRAYPYERYFVTVQGTPWLEATLRYSSVGNRLYSDVPDFSGNQSYKDRGLDIKLKLLGEGALRPALAVGARDFLGTGLFSSEYIVLNKEAGPLDLSFGVGWGNMGTRGHIKNPLRFLSSSYRDRGSATAGGGTLNNSYFKGDTVALFGGIRYDTPIPHLTAKIEYDPNDYQSEALNNQFDVDLPVNFGLEYSPRSWLQLGAGFERGNKVALKLVLTTNFNIRAKAPKIDPPAPPMRRVAEDPANPAPGALTPPEAPASTAPVTDAVPTAAPAAIDPSVAARQELTVALARQGAALYAVDFQENSATLYVAQSRFRNMATGVGRIARAAFSVLPSPYLAVKVVLVESGMETMAVTMYRSALEKALTPGQGSIDELRLRSEFSAAPLDLGEADSPSRSRPGFFYAIRPGLRTTLGRPEQFILYQLWLRLHGSLELGRGLSMNGSVGLNLSDNFDKLRNDSDSVLPRVRSDIKNYLRDGRTAITHLQGDYNFNISPGLYGHVYGGLLEEMFGGVGGEVLYRPYDANWALGVDINYAKQRDFDQRFSFRDYDVVTGHVTGFYHFETMDVDAIVKAGRYLAKDWGTTLQLSRTFKSGVSVGAFATFTDVPASTFGEGRFDKGLFITVPLDIFYIRNVRSGIGLAWRPLIRDGGQMLVIRRPLLGTTGAATKYNLDRDWREILD